MRTPFADNIERLKFSGKALVINIAGGPTACAGSAYSQFQLQPYERDVSLFDGQDGVKAWIPIKDPPRDYFYGIDRSYDAIRFSGNRVSADGASFDIGVSLAVHNAMLFGGRPSTLYVPGKKFKGKEFSINQVGLEIRVVGDDSLTGSFCFLLQDDTWQLCENDELSILCCSAPGYNTRIQGLDLRDSN